MSWRSVLAIRVGKPLGASAAVSSDTRAAIMPGKLVRSFLSARLEGDTTEHNGGSRGETGGEGRVFPGASPS